LATNKASQVQALALVKVLTVKKEKEQA